MTNPNYSLIERVALIETLFTQEKKLRIPYALGYRIPKGKFVKHDISIFSSIAPALLHQETLGPEQIEKLEEYFQSYSHIHLSDDMLYAIEPQKISSRIPLSPLYSQNPRIGEIISASSDWRNYTGLNQVLDTTDDLKILPQLTYINFEKRIVIADPTKEDFARTYGFRFHLSDPLPDYPALQEYLDLIKHD